MADIKETKAVDSKATDTNPEVTTGADTKAVDAKVAETQSTADVTSTSSTPEAAEPQPLENGLYLLIFDKPWNGYNAKEQAAFDKARAELLVNSKIARYVPATAA